MDKYICIIYKYVICIFIQYANNFIKINVKYQLTSKNYLHIEKQLRTWSHYKSPQRPVQQISLESFPFYGGKIINFKILYQNFSDIKYQ